MLAYKSRFETRLGPVAGRATFYGGPPSFTNAFLVRGAGAYGDLLYGSCGFFQTRRNSTALTEEDVPYPRDQVAALVCDPPYACTNVYKWYRLLFAEGLHLKQRRSDKTWPGT